MEKDNAPCTCHSVGGNSCSGIVNFLGFSTCRTITVGHWSLLYISGGEITCWWQ